MYKGGAEMRKQEPPLRDVFAAQWLIAVVLGLIFVGMQMFVPEAAAALMGALAETAEKSPQIGELAEQFMQKISALLF